MKKIFSLIKKYKEIILYLIVGGLTTLVDFCVYFFSTRVFSINETASTAIAWALSVLFAFFANKIFVFEAKNTGKKKFVFEIISFFGARIFTGGLNVLIIFIFVDKLEFYDIPVKIATYVINIVLNYIASKFLIFRKNK